MRISREVSGNAETRDVPASQGRGEYEWCEPTAEDPPNSQLLNARIYLALPGGGRIDTGCLFDYPDGQDKNRLRTADDAPDRLVYPIWHAAALLMMPRPNRSQSSWGGGLPVLRNAQYGIAHLRMARVTVPANGQADLEIGTIDSVNHYAQDTQNFAERFQRVQRLWQHRASFDAEIEDLLREHHDLAQAGQPTFADEALPVVARLQTAAANTAADYGISASATTDVLPVLIALLECLQAPQPAAPPPPSSIPSEESSIRIRSAKQWRRWANARGPSAITFRRQVRAAYRFTCLVCGLHLPSLGPGTNPGVDACHILPWADFDIDDVCNGICLCKLHHWAFDEGLIEVVHDGISYQIVIPQEARDRAAGSMDLTFLDPLVGPIPPARLPRLIAQRPRPEYLHRLREEMFG